LGYAAEIFGYAVKLKKVANPTRGERGQAREDSTHKEHLLTWREFARGKAGGEIKLKTTEPSQSRRDEEYSLSFVSEAGCSKNPKAKTRRG